MYFSLIYAKIVKVLEQNKLLRGIVPVSRWDLFPPGIITCLSLPVSQRLKPPLE